jgi:hypothetical protein
MPGKPFRSKLQPHVETIVAMRRKGATWAGIAVQLTAQGCATDAGSVCRFLGRWERRPYARGMEPEGETKAATPQIPPHQKAPPRPARQKPPAAIAPARLSPEELIEETSKPTVRVIGKATKGF